MLEINMNVSEMTYGEFLENFEFEMDMLDVYDANGIEIDDLEDSELFQVPVIGFSRRGGYFDVQLDY